MDLPFFKEESDTLIKDIKENADAMLGRGGMGAVYKIRQDVLIGIIKQNSARLKKSTYAKTKAEYVAVKIMLPGAVLYSSVVREIKMMMLLADKCAAHNLACFIDYFETAGTYGAGSDGLVIVMEYIAGKSLLDYKVMGKSFTALEIATIIYEIAKALVFLHSNGIAHNDVKLGNILFDENGKEPPRLVDFGFTCQRDDLVSEEFKDVACEPKSMKRGTLKFFSRKKFAWFILNASESELKSVLYNNEIQEIRDTIIKEFSGSGIVASILDLQKADIWAFAMTIEMISAEQSNFDYEKLWPLNETTKKYLLSPVSWWSLLTVGYKAYFGEIRSDKSGLSLYDDYVNNLKRLGLAYGARFKFSERILYPFFDILLSRPQEQDVWTGVQQLENVGFNTKAEILKYSSVMKHPAKKGAPRKKKVNAQIEYIACIKTKKNPQFMLVLAPIKAQGRQLVIWNRHAKTFHCKCNFQSLKQAKTLFSGMRESANTSASAKGVCPLCGK